MHNMPYQKGLGALGWIVVLALISFFTLVGLKIIPVYMNSLTVSSIMSDMETELDISQKSPSAILATFSKRLSINVVKDISRDEIYLDTTKDSYILEVDYEVRRDFIGNIDLVLSFNKTAVIPKQ